MSDIGVGGIGKLKKQIKSIEGIKKVSKSMALVSTSKLRKIRSALDINIDYYNAYNEIINELKKYLSDENIFLEGNKSNKKLTIVMASDRGMCGGYNYAILDKLNEINIKEDENCSLIIIGKRGLSLCKRHEFNISDFEFYVSEHPTLEEAKIISDYCIDSFLSGEFGTVSIIYTWFKNPLVKEVRERVLLPLNKEDDNSEGIDEFDIVGNCNEVFDKLISDYCSSLIFNLCLNSKAAEHSVRMETMNSATKSADDLIGSLKQKYNRLRQAEITQEISEIIGGTHQ